MQARRRDRYVCLLSISFLLLSSAPAQRTGGSSMPPSPNPPPPLVHGQESTFDQTRVRFDSNVPKLNATNLTSDTCLFPPFQSIQNSTVAVNRLQVPAKARKEYQDACSAIRDKKFDVAEKHLRKAVQEES